MRIAASPSPVRGALAAVAVAVAGVGVATALASDDDGATTVEAGSAAPAPPDSAPVHVEQRLPESELPEPPKALPRDPGYTCIVVDYLTPGPHPPDPCYRTVDGRPTTERIDPATGEAWEGPDEWAEFAERWVGEVNAGR